MLVIRPSVVNRYILAFDKCGPVQAPMKRGQGLPGVTGRFAFEESNDRHLRLLRARRERPRRRAANEGDELAAPLHWHIETIVLAALSLFMPFSQSIMLTPFWAPPASAARALR
jgi:hypothetical protein